MALQITVAALKGGVGKSTLTLNLATCLHRDGHRVLIVDTDRQGTCKTWAAIASEGGAAGPAVVAMNGAALRRDLPSLAAGYDVVVIDSPPYAGPEARAAMLAADLIVIPTVPGAADAWALQDTLDVLADVRALRPEIVATVLLNRADRTRLTAAVRDTIAGLGLPLLGAELAVRVTYGEATLAGRGVVDYAPGSPAAKEVEKLTAAVLAAFRNHHGQTAADDGQPRATPTPAAAAAPDPGAGSRGASVPDQGAGPGPDAPERASSIDAPAGSAPASGPRAAGKRSPRGAGTRKDKVRKGGG